MNVSSVKNLNGETFSAVQDATLTDVVQTNSSNWDKVTNKLDATSFSDVSGSFLTAVDLSNYYTKSETSGASEIADALANIPTGNPEVDNYVQTNSGTIDETVTSFQTNSSTYMVEPNLEFNAVNEISAYNGSAIAQYGAEKQWLTHDGTLCHLSNSAQYALGVNLSAVAQLLGVDETVLYENSAGFTTATSGMPLSEKADNFNKLKIVHFWNGNGNWDSYGETIVPITNNRITLSHISDISTASGSTYHVTNSIAFESTAHDKFIHMGGWRASFINNGNPSTSDITRITKIIGIGRKQ